MYRGASAKVGVIYSSINRAVKISVYGSAVTAFATNPISDIGFM